MDTESKEYKDYKRFGDECKRAGIDPYCVCNYISNNIKTNGKLEFKTMIEYIDKLKIICKNKKGEITTQNIWK